MITLGTNHAPPGLPIAAVKVKPSKAKADQKPMGRPTVMTPDVIRKLEDAFGNAFTDEMACLYAGISEVSLYRYCEDNPDFRERKEELKRTPWLTAQKELVENIKGNLHQARWYAEHIMPLYMPKTKVEHSGHIGGQEGYQGEAAKKVAVEFEERLKEAIITDAKAKQ